MISGRYQPQLGVQLGRRFDLLRVHLHNRALRQRLHRRRRLRRSQAIAVLAFCLDETAVTAAAWPAAAAALLSRDACRLPPRLDPILNVFEEEEEDPRGGGHLRR